MRDKIAAPTAPAAPAAESMPTSVLTAQFTKVDEAVYCGNLKGLLTPEDERAIDLLEAQMTTHQVEQFRLMIINMVNPDVSANRMEPILDKAGKPTGAKKSVPYTVNHAFTAKDTRVLRLRLYAAKITGGITPAKKKKAAAAIVAKLLQEGSITEKSVSDIGKEKLEGAKQALADGAFDAATFVLLGDEHRAIHATKAREATKARRINAALDAKLITKQAELEGLGVKGMFKSKWTYAYIIAISGGLVYILFI